MQLLKGHLYGKPVRSLAFSPDGTKLASCGIDGKTFLWDLAGGKGRVIDKDYANAAAFSPDGKVLAVGRYSEMTLWDIDTEQSRLVVWDGVWYNAAIAFGVDGRTVIAVGSTIEIWEIASESRVPSPGFDGEEARSPTNSLALTPDRKTMATGHNRQERCVRLWDVESRSFQGEIPGPTAIVTALAFSPDGKYLAATAGTTLWVWEVASKRVAVKHSIDRKYFKDVAFTPDGRFLVFARNDATVSLWDTATWTEAASYDFGIGPMVSVACAPDGMRAAGGSAKGKIVVFDIDV